MNCYKLYIFTIFILAIAAINGYSQVVGGGSLEKPVAAQLGGLINSNVFNKLKTPSSSKTKQTPTKSKTTAKTTKSKSKTKTAPSKDSIISPSSDYNAVKFRPSRNTGVDRILASSISNDAAIQRDLINLFQITKNAYNNEAAKRGKTNDVAMAMTFFISSMVTVYNNSAEPSETAIQNLYDILADSMNEDSNFIKTSNTDKQMAHDTLVYVSGLVLGGYELGKTQNDRSTIQSFRELAGICLQSLTQLDPKKLSFNQKGLVFKS